MVTCGNGRENQIEIENVSVRRFSSIRARAVESSEVGHVERTTSVDTPVRRAHNEGLIAVRVAPFGSHSGNV